MYDQSVGTASRIAFFGLSTPHGASTPKRFLPKALTAQPTSASPALTT